MKTACKKMITQQVSEILRIEIEDGDLYPGTKYLLTQNWLKCLVFRSKL